MAQYAIGDIQGCFQELKALLNQIGFNQDSDTLWLAGDLVNRGPSSLEVLRFAKSLGNRCIVTLGNHDLHLLAVAKGFQKVRPHDTFVDILEAKDRDELLDWLRFQKLLHYDEKLNIVMTHAGIYPGWDLAKAQQRAKEVEAVLRSDDYKNLLSHMYGNTPDRWHENLTGFDRLRFIINAFARMRYCFEDTRLELHEKGPIGTQAADLYPWFKIPTRKPVHAAIVFGHWASLNGITNTPHIFAVDTGCSWGHALTALNLNDHSRHTYRALTSHGE